MTSSATTLWFASHEIRLASRELLSMLTAGRRWSGWSAAIALMSFVALLHLPAYAVVGDFAQLRAPLDLTSLVVATAMLGLAWALIASQAIESVTRVFYARADLDLIMSSPITLAHVFSVRIGAIALTVTLGATLLATPFIDVLVASGGVRWFAVYGVVIALGLSAAAFAIALTVLMFRVFGPKRTRLVAQIVAAVTGAGFVIALQVAAIVSTGTLSRFAVLTSEAATRIAPSASSVAWWPAQALLGDVTALLALLSGSMILLGMTMIVVAPRFAGYVSRVLPDMAITAEGARSRTFRAGSQRGVLIRKEITLLLRDPWLVSQSLMQLLYLLPPALLMWRSFGETAGSALLVAPVIVMAAGQLAGGLAWLTISGEDAPDLIATAPLPATRALQLKAQTVLLLIAGIFTPLVGMLALVSIWTAAMTALCAVLATMSATAIQIWFRVHAKRTHFRRRQTSSRFATFAEAMASIGWSATAVLALIAPIPAIASAVVTMAVVTVAWLLAPRA